MGGDAEERARREGVRQGRQDALLESFETRLGELTSLTQNMNDSLIALKIKMASIGAATSAGTVGIVELVKMWSA
jgi:hypothetical protein